MFEPQYSNGFSAIFVASYATTSYSPTALSSRFCYDRVSSSDDCGSNILYLLISLSNPYSITGTSLYVNSQRRGLYGYQVISNVLHASQW